jgi:pimeloyl-ACP methyl ester carboxylesterase
MDQPTAYTPRRPSQDVLVPVRGLRYHLTTWGDPAMVTPERPALFMGHGFMDVGASFQFVVDALADLEGPTRYIVAPDWRGFGRTDAPPVDSYWFADYLGDLDALLDGRVPGLDGRAQPIDLLGHSMGGNIVMSYAGVRPTHIRRLVNLEGFGMPATKPEEAPSRLARWLDQLTEPQSLRDYDDLQGVIVRLQQNNPRLAGDKAAWLATRWSTQKADGRWRILGDPAHKRVNALLYRVEEVLATWRRITAPVLWVNGEDTDTTQWWGHRYTLDEFYTRLAVVPQVERHTLARCGHMLHHDQPEALAGHLLAFLTRA